MGQKRDCTGTNHEYVGVKIGLERNDAKRGVNGDKPHSIYNLGTNPHSQIRVSERTNAIPPEKFRIWIPVTHHH